MFGAANVSNILSAAFVRDSMGGSVIDPDTGKRITFREQVKDKETGRMLNKGICKVTESGKIVKYLRDKKDNVVGEKYIADMPGGAQWKDRVTSTVLVTGFITGNLGVWLRNHKTPFQPQLMRVVRAHKPGPQIVLADGSISFGGVRCLKIRSDEKTLISARADGAVHQWDVKQYVDDAPWMTAVGAQTSVSDKRPTKKGEVNKALLARGAVRLKKLDGWSHKVESVYENEAPPMFRGLDCMPGSHVFVAGTNRCDIWEVDETPRVLVYGHMAEVYSLAIHPTDPDKYASCCLSTRIFVWSVAQKTMTRTADVGLMCKEIAFSRCGQHLALGGKHGRIKIVNAETLQPLESFKYCETAIDEIKYSPNNQIMAAGSHDLVIDIYDTGMRADGKGKAKYGKVARYPEVNCVYGDEAVYKKAGYKGGYQRIARCQGHSATIKHLDFSLPLFDARAARQDDPTVQLQQQGDPVLRLQDGREDQHEPARRQVGHLDVLAGLQRDGDLGGRRGEHGHQRRHALPLPGVLHRVERLLDREALQLPVRRGQRPAPRVPRARQPRDQGPVVQRRPVRLHVRLGGPRDPAMEDPRRQQDRLPGAVPRPAHRRAAAVPQAQRVRVVRRGHVLLLRPDGEGQGQAARVGAHRRRGQVLGAHQEEVRGAGADERGEIFCPLFPCRPGPTCLP